MARPSLEPSIKFKILVRRLGLPRPFVRGLLETLWDVGYTCGDPVIGDADAVEIAAEWPGEDGAFFEALRHGGWIDETEDGRWEIHDFWDHAPDYVRKRRKRELERQLLGFSLDRNGLPRASVLAVFNRDPHECSLCGSTRRLVISHEVPRADGGGDDPENLRLLCAKCSQGRASDRSLADNGGQWRTVTRTPAPSPTPIKKKKHTRVLSEAQRQEFDLFWSAWPKHKRKVNKADAQKAWAQTEGDRPSIETILAHLEQAKRCEKWLEDDGDYIPMPATWIRAHGWDDVLTLPKERGPYQ